MDYTVGIQTPPTSSNKPIEGNNKTFLPSYLKIKHKEDIENNFNSNNRLRSRSKDDENTDLLHHATVHVNTSTSTAAGLWILVDGIGLALITACTILEAFDMWRDHYKACWISNSLPLIIWFGGKVSQVVGLLFLLLYAASFQLFPEIERFGMFMLTIGPLLNIVSCSLFDPGSDPYYLFNKRWLTSEVLEVIGIGTLDISLIDMEEKLVLFFEVCGFGILCCAALLDFEYPSPYPFEEGENLSMFPKIAVRLDLIHTNECGGLLLLTLVAIGQYYLKVFKHNQMHLQAAAVGNTVGHLQAAHSHQHHHTDKDKDKDRDKDKASSAEAISRSESEAI
eukprot:gene27970-36839_t